MQEFDAFVLAALLSGTGRLQQRSRDGGGASAPEAVACAWLREEGLQAIADEIERWHPLFQEAAQLAVGEGDTLQGDPSRPLVCPFATLGQPTPEGYDRHWYNDPSPDSSPPYGLRHDPGFRLAPGTYADLWQRMRGEFARLKAVLAPNTVLAWLERHTTRVPYAPDPPDAPLADIALFDHIRTMTAIASCLYLYLRHGADQVDPSRPATRRTIEDRALSRYLLVGGDVPGIQEFVYRITSKGALKGLRGRSFFLELLTRHVAAELLRLGSVELSWANVLLAGGGRLDVLLPDTPVARQRVAQVRRRLNGYLRRVQDARLSLLLDWQELCGLDFMRPADSEEGLGARWRRLMQKLDHRKRHRAAEALEEDPTGERCRHCQRQSLEMVPAEECQRWGIAGPVCEFCFLLLPKEPAPPPATWRRFEHTTECEWCHQPGTRAELRLGEERLFGCDNRLCLGGVETHHVGECEVCHRRAVVAPMPPAGGEAAGQVHACAFCRNLYHVGEHLSQITLILRSPEEPPAPQRVFLQIDDHFYYFPGPQGLSPWQQLTGRAGTTIWVVNEPDPTQWRFPACSHPLLLGIYPGLHEQDADLPLEFEKLGTGLGARRIGVLRMDVDNLGALFREVSGSLARTAALSRLLGTFFSLHLARICRGTDPSLDRLRVGPARDAPRKLVIVYAGGDDLCLVGHWHEVAEVAFDIGQAFRTYTCENPVVGLSGGFAVQHVAFPLHQMAELAKRAEDAAKAHTVGSDWRKQALAPFFPSRSYAASDAPAQAAFKWTPRPAMTPAVPTARDFLAFVQAMVDAMLIFRRREPGRSEQQGPPWQVELQEGISHGLLQHLAQVVGERERRGKLYLPRLVYALSRAPGLPPALHAALLQPQVMAYLDPALTWLELLLRREER
jgi:hypothetical protein